MVLLTSKTSIYEKFNKPCELQLSFSDWKLWTVITVLASLVDWEFFFFGIYRLSHYWSFNLRPWDRTNISSYSSSQSHSPYLSLHFCQQLFLHFLFFSIFFFRLLFLHFSLSLCFSLCTLESFDLFWRWLTTCILLPTK